MRMLQAPSLILCFAANLLTAAHQHCAKIGVESPQLLLDNAPNALQHIELR